jgi:hypothetical protein
MTDRATPAPDEAGSDVDQTPSDPDQTVSDGDQDVRLPSTKSGRKWPSALDLERAFD